MMLATCTGICISQVFKRKTLYDLDLMNIPVLEVQEALTVRHRRQKGRLEEYVLCLQSSFSVAISQQRVK